MKNVLIRWCKIFSLISVLTLMIGSCDQYVPQDETTGSMKVSLSIENAKLTAPELSQSDFSFVIDGDGPGDSTFHVETTQGENSALIEDLAFGTWTITVEALYHGASGTVSFGDGVATVEVSSGTITNCAVSITPFQGQGVLNIVVNWNSASVQSPVLEGTLSRTGYDPIAIPFTMGSGQARSTMTLNSGIYRLSIVLKDGSSYVFAGAADSIRISNALTTSAAYTLNGETGKGSLDISISIDMPTSIEAVISGGSSTITRGTSIALTGSAPAETGQLYFFWYLNGEMTQQGSTYTVPGSLLSGPYRIDLIVYNSDYSRSGAATYLFTVTE